MLNLNQNYLEKLGIVQHYFPNLNLQVFAMNISYYNINNACKKKLT